VLSGSRHLAEFHNLTDIFVTKGAVTTKHGWNDIPKLHMLIHYAHMIREYGTTDGFNTESSERLHIDYVKLGYRASNKVEPVQQMIIYLQQREAWAMLRQSLEDAIAMVMATLQMSRGMTRKMTGKPRSTRTKR
jgi:hypothetical protein